MTEAKSKPSADKAIVLFRKGQNFFSAFFSELALIRQEIPNDREFADWCLYDLKIPVPTINRIAGVLNVADTERQRAELKSVRDAEEARKRQEREVRKAATDAENRRRQQEKEAAAAEKAREEERKKAAEKAARKKTSKAKNNAGWKAKQRKDTKAAMEKLAAAVAGSDKVVPFRPAETLKKSEADLVKDIQEGQHRMRLARDEWIEGAVQVAEALCEARTRYPADQRFSHWLEANGIDIHHNERSAMLHMGVHPDAMRVLLKHSDRSSIQLIWEDVKLRLAG
jgi:flagellar biosynthesis GTPase FlhF